MKIEDLKFVRNIGRGGFGKVDEYVNTQGEHFAVKFFSIADNMKEIQDNARKRFVKEAQVQSKINHHNIVPITDIDITGDSPYYIMPVAETTLLDEMLAEDKIEENEFFQCFYDIMAGLEEIHSLGIYHRDLKPGNVLKFAGYYSIGDFGLMSLKQTGISTLTTAGMRKSSDFYTAPEITVDLRRACAQSDIYSLGCILHDFVRVKDRIPCNEISEKSQYADILYCATRCDPSRRFPNVAAFREALDSVIQDNDEPVKKTMHTERILKVLKQDILSSENISMLSDFLSSNIIDDEKNAVLSEISLDHIQKIIEDGTHFSFIARAYCEYVRNNSFTWNFCDTLANRVALFIDNGSVDIKAEGILALLYMGTSHNRWYVERKFVNYISGDIERSLLKRMQIEIAIDNTEFVYAISHLCRSINTTIDSFNTDIANSIRKVNNND